MPERAAGALRDPVRREDRQPLLAGRDDHGEQPGRRLAAVLLVERERRLVAVMPVGDQELRVGELLDSASENSGSSRQSASDAAFVRRQVGLAETVDLDRAVPEEEERLELRARRAEQPQPALLRPRVRALVRQDDAVLVRLEPERSDEPLAAPVDAVRADVLLREPPARRLGVASEHAAARCQSARLAAASSSESGSVRWTTLYGLRPRSSSRCSGPMTS